MIIRHTNKGSTIKDIVMAQTGLSEEELLGIKKKDYKVSSIWIDSFEEDIKKHNKVMICCDYDVDGITSGYMMGKILEELGVEPIIRAPYRISEGFGTHKSQIDEAIAQNCTAIVTTDNGIAANDTIAYAKSKGLYVVITDHHLSNDILPDADMILNPTIQDDEISEFHSYCGAGIVYKIAEYIIKDEEKIKEMRALAAIATIADCVPLVGDNRNIVKEGLKEAEYLPKCLKQIMKQLNIPSDKPLSVSDIAFKIAPILNAEGRMSDVPGANSVIKSLMEKDGLTIHVDADSLIETNEERKKLQTNALKSIKHELTENENNYQPNKVVVMRSDIPEGILGIIASQICEEYKVPAFIFTETEEGIKGSARGTEEYHIKDMLDQVSDTMIKYGGHAQAAGMTVKKEDFDKFKNSIEAMCHEKNNKEKVIDCVLSINGTNLGKQLSELKEEYDMYGPFGEGNPSPNIHIVANLVPNTDGTFYKTMGSEKQHLKLNLEKDLSLIIWNGAEAYSKLGNPASIETVINGSDIGFNEFNGKTTMQIFSKPDLIQSKLPEIEKEKSPLSIKSAFR